MCPLLILVCVFDLQKVCLTANESGKALFGFPVIIKGEILKSLGSVEK